MTWSAPDGTSGEEKFTLKHGESKTIEIPVGSSITAVETADGYTASITAEGATPTISNDNTTAVIDKFGKYGAELHFTNNLDITVDTGILLDSVPYVLLLALVGAGIGFMIIRRRRRED